MAGKTQPYTKGDWVVHTYYGVGQIVKLETKLLNEKRTRCYQVKTKDSTYWVPLKTADNPRLRHLASKYQMRKALKFIKEEPQPLDEDNNIRRKQIEEVRSSGSLYDIARLLRDLHGRRKSSSLNAKENQTLDWCTHRLLKEWTIAMGIPQEDAHHRLDEILQGA